MKFAVAFFCALSVIATVARSEQTNAVDLAALAACGTGTTNGWELVGIDSYKDGKTNIRLSEKGDSARSPDFGLPIRAFAVRVKSSSAANRRLAFIPWDGTRYRTEDALACDYSPTKDSYVAQTLEFPWHTSYTRFTIALEDSGNTGWGLSELLVITDDPCLATTPEGLHAREHDPTHVQLVWTNAANTAANRIYLSRIVHTPESGLVEECIDFSAITNTRATATAWSATAPLSGETLYAAAHATNELQIGNSGRPGVLVHSGRPSYSDLTLSLNLRRYDNPASAENDKGVLDILALSPDGAGGVTTNEVAHIAGLAASFQQVTVPLGGTSPGAALAFSTYGAASPNRVILREIRFIRDFCPGTCETNSPAVFDLPAATAGETARIVRLSSRSEYIAYVSALDANGAECRPTPPLEIKTGECTGLLISLR